MAAAINSSIKLSSEVSETRHTWTTRTVVYNNLINCFIFLEKVEEKIAIAPTCFKTSIDTKWSWQCLRKYENGYVYHGLRIIYDSYDYTPTRAAEFKFVIINEQQRERVLNEFTHKSFGRNNDIHYASTGIPVDHFGRYAMVPEIGEIQVVCTVRDTSYFPIPPCQLQHDFDTILSNQQFTDVSLVVDGHTLKAHKAFLAARSPVFAAMFNSDMLELRQGQVIIPDMEYKVAQHLLLFIYTGKTEIAPDMADGLLVAADKYGLMRLKAQCEEYICSAITTTTAVKTLLFADRVNAEHLKSNTMAFIKANSKKVMESDDWKSMIKDPTLLNEVCCTLASY